MERAQRAAAAGALKRFAAAVAIALCGCSHGSSAGSRSFGTVAGELRYTEGQDVDTLNPTLSSQLVTTHLSELTQGYLFTYASDYGLIPSMCVQIPTPQNGLISRDGKTITYKLRRGARWQDGVPFTSADIVFTAKTILDPRYNASNTVAFTLISSVSAPDPYTVIVKLKRPSAAFVAQFLTPNVGSGILPKHLLAGTNVNRSPWNALPIGLGPFRYTRWERGGEIDMAANDRWWGGRPHLRRIVYRIVTNANSAIAQIAARDLDAFAYIPNEQYPNAQAIPGTTTYAYASDAYEHIDFNLSNPVLQDLRVREALASAIDTADIVRTVDHGAGFLACSPIPHTSWAYDAALQCPRFDLAHARALLDAAGWRMSADGIRRKGSEALRLDLVSTVGNPTRDGTAVLIQSWFRAIGVDLSYRRFQANQLFAYPDGILESGKFDLALSSWFWSADPDITGLYTCAARAPAGQNMSRYCNPRVDTLLRDALAHYDHAQRRADYARVQEILAHDLPSIVVYQRMDHMTIRNGFTGIDPGPGGSLPRPELIGNGAQ